MEMAIDTAGQLHRSALRLLRLMRGTGSDEGLGMAKLSVLGHLYRHGTTTPTALAAHMRIQPQSLTRLLADLQHRKLITRRPDPADRRQSLMEITTAGSKLLTEAIHDQRTELARIIAASLTPAEQEMLRIAAGLMDLMADAASDRPSTSV